MSNPFDKFDGANPFDKFDKPKGKLPAETGNPLSRIGGAFTGAVDKLGKDVKADYTAAAASKDYGTLKSYGRKAEILGDVANLAMAPIGQAFEEAIVKPYARGAAKVLPFTTEENNAADMRTALSAASFAKGKVPAITRAPKAAKPTMADTVARFDKAGVRPSLAATGGKGTATVTNVVAENPLAGVAVRGRLKGAVADVGQSADRIATGYGSNRGSQIAGENVQTGVKRFAKDANAPTSFKAKSGKLYDDAFQPIELAEARAVERSATDFASRKTANEASRAAAVAKQEAEFEAATAAEKNRVDLLYARGYQKVPPAEIKKPDLPPAAELAPERPAVTPTQTVSVLREMSGRVNAPRLSNMITDGRIKSIMGALEQDGASVRFNDIRALRTWVRNAQGDETLRQGMDKAGLQRIESALTEDIYANAERLAGPSALHRLKRADDYYRAGSTRIKNALESFAKNGTPGESAYSRITQAASSGGRADARQLVSLKRSLSPEEWGDVAATQIKQMGQPAKGAADALDPEAFSINTFVTNYAKLSDRGREVLFGSTGGGGAKASTLKAELDNLMSVASDLKGVEKGANASLSAVNAQTLATGGGLLNPSTALPTTGILSSMAVTGEMLTNPVAVRALAALGQAARAGQPALVRQLARLNAAAKSNAALVPVAQAANALQLPGPAGAIRAVAEPRQEQQP